MMMDSLVVGPILFGFFCVSFNIILINLLISVVLEGFTAVRRDKQKQSNDYEIVEFVMKRAKMVLGVGQPKKSRRHNLPVSDPRKSRFVYVESKYFLLSALLLGL
ncbi:hypothetical protein DPMN_034405 [Dreissena polymorpha]|uniref:Uncharacterized protein n=1 Tax=Dreissena polymorpha TaxID=45954 RepID=A0A9D4MA48_DREPO|nr:hypothetical protein DPMN_034405 [Dreissena polymorpha]